MLQSLRQLRQVSEVNWRTLRPLINHCQFQVQNHLGDLQLRHSGHLLVSPRRGVVAVQDPECDDHQVAGAHFR